METVEKIKQQIAENPIIVYMKGSPKLPSCGFSSQVAQIMINCGASSLRLWIFSSTQIFVLNYLSMQTGQPSHNCGLKAS